MTQPTGTTFAQATGSPEVTEGVPTPKPKRKYERRRFTPPELRQSGPVIESDVPIPAFTTLDKWPLLKMAVGQSFSYPESNENSVRGAIRLLQKQEDKASWKFQTAKDPKQARNPDGSPNGPVTRRVWRTA